MRLAHVAAITGATPRQLQWWDERKFIRPKRDGHNRNYSNLQVIEVAVTVILRKKGIGWAGYRKLWKVIRRILVDYRDLVEMRPRYIVTDFKKVESRVTREGVLGTVCGDEWGPVVIIDLFDLSDEIAHKMATVKLPRSRTGLPIGTANEFRLTDGQRSA